MSSLGWGFEEATLYYHNEKYTKHKAGPDLSFLRQPCHQIRQFKNDITATGSEKDGPIAIQAAQEMPAKRVGSVLHSRCIRGS